MRVIIRFDGRKCIHSWHGVLDRPDVFVPNVKGEWIYLDRAAVEEIAELARNCPSGAICTGTGRTVDRVTKAALYRCGQSSNKPFCDGFHTRVVFKAES